MTMMKGVPGTKDKPMDCDIYTSVPMFNCLYKRGVFLHVEIVGIGKRCT